MSLQIIRGKKSGAVRAVIYGVEGIGKSTLAAQIPDSLIVDVEDGTGQIETARVVALDWRAIEHAAKELIADPQGFRAVIFDTADWLEKALIDHMLRQSGKKSIEDYGYGKGYTILQEHVVRFLGLVDQLVAKGIHVVFVAHATCKRTSPPDQTDGYDRYELKLTKQVAPLLKEWADLVVFCNYKINIVEGTDGKLKAQGGKERVMYSTRTAAWDAKNRYGLPEEMAMEFAQIAHLFVGAEARAVSPVQAAVAATNAAVISDPGPVTGRATPAQIARLIELNKTPQSSALVETALLNNEAIEIAELPADQAALLIADIEKLGSAKVENRIALTSKMPPGVAEWLDANKDAVNAYLVRVKWITLGQTWRDLSDDNTHKLLDKEDKFARAAGIAMRGERKAA